MGYPQFGLDRNDAAQAGFDAGWLDIRLDAVAASEPTASGRMIMPKRLRGMAASAPLAVGRLSVPKRVTGEAHNAALAEGALTVPKTVAGAAQSLFTSAVLLSVPKRMRATATGDAQATGRLSVPKRMAGVVKSESDVSATLMVRKTLRGRAEQRGTVTGALTSMVWPIEVDGYVRLITSQHVTRPRFITAVKALTAQAVEVQHCLRVVASAFDLDSAVGVQLDQVGLWVGVSRVLRVGLTGVYFSFDEDGVGWDEGVWRGQYDPETQLVRLHDDQYRILIYARIAANHWDGTIPSAYAIWETLFPGSQIIIQDWQNMSMTVGIAGLPLNAVLRALLTGGYIPLKPEGVRVDYYAVGTAPGPLLAFDAESEAPDKALAGWDEGQWPVELQPQHTGVRYASQ